MLLLDNSAWARLNSPKLGEWRREEIARLVEERQIATCLPFLLEAGYSARSREDHDLLRELLEPLPRLAINERVERQALLTQRHLVLRGHHRLAPVDLLIAALAAEHGAGVLHYDRDYDLIRELTPLRFDSVWLAERGTL